MVQTIEQIAVIQPGAFIDRLESTDNDLRRDGQTGALRGPSLRGKNNADIAMARDRHIRGLERKADEQRAAGQTAAAQRYEIQAKYVRAEGAAGTYGRMALGTKDPDAIASCERRVAEAKDAMADANAALARLDEQARTQWQRTADDRRRTNEAALDDRRNEATRIGERQRDAVDAVNARERAKVREDNYLAKIEPGGQSMYRPLIEDIRMRYAQQHGADERTYVMTDRERATAHSLVVDQRYGQFGRTAVKETTDAANSAELDAARQAAQRRSADVRDRSMRPALQRHTQPDLGIGLNSLRDAGLHARQEQDRIVYTRPGSSETVMTEHETRLTVHRAGQESPANRAAALAAAAEKFPQGFKINAPNSERAQAWAREAVEQGLGDKITNAELQDYIRDYTAAHAEERNQERAVLPDPAGRQRDTEREPEPERAMGQHTERDGAPEIAIREPSPETQEPGQDKPDELPESTQEMTRETRSEVTEGGDVEGHDDEVGQRSESSESSGDGNFDLSHLDEETAEQLREVLQMEAQLREGEQSQTLSEGIRQ